MTSSLEDIKSIDLEEWLTLATAPAPTKLQQGQSPDMQNVWTDEKPGSVITAPGIVKVGTFNVGSGGPVTFCINYFNTTSGSQIFVASNNQSVAVSLDFQTWTAIISGLSSSFQLRGAVIRDKLWLTNGNDPVHVYDGTTVTVLDGTNGTPNVPRGRYIAYHDERVWIYHVSSARSAVYFSSLTDSSANIIDPDNVNAWDTTDNFLQISEGDADFGTGMFLYRGYLHFFKQYSIWRLVGYDEYTYSRVKTRASTGTRFQESVQELDSLIHLIGVDGIYVFDGEESVRISDIIDPATASQTAFGFNQLQQPNTNNQFWEVTSTADWNTGTVPTDLVINNAATLQAADDSQADFQAGPTQTNIDLVTNPGLIQLSHINSGVSSPNVAFNQIASLSFTGALIGQIGVSQFITDGGLTNAVGGGFGTGPGSVKFTIPVPNNAPISQIILKGLRRDSGGTYTILDQSNNVLGSGSQLNFPVATDITINIFPATATTITVELSQVIAFPVSSPEVMTVTEIQIFQTAFNVTGQFVSKTLNLGITPAALGTFNATETLNGETTSYFTQSSPDGSTWEAAATVTNGGAITSTPQQYLRWGVNLTSDGANTPQIDAAFLPAVYISAIHNTGGNIFSWGPFQADYSLAGQTISFYYRGATTLVGIPSAPWNLIVPGGVLSIPTADVLVQFKIEISGGNATALPSVTSVTINWVVGTAGQPQTLQNVASTYWRNRYWLSAAGPSATSNNLILIRGKKTFNSPWMLKDWNILSFARYFDSLYGGSSIDGSIYQLDSGYSEAGLPMDSHFETGDFTFGGFTANLVELLVEAERSGPWNLSIGVSIDGGNTFDTYLMDLTPSTFDNEYIKRIHVNYTTTRFRLRFSTDGVDTPFQVHRCLAFYTLSGVRGSIRGDYM
jgi:hypothetical protein